MRTTVTSYMVYKNCIETRGYSTQFDFDMVSNLELDITINNLVNVYSSLKCKYINVIIADSINNHNEILDTVQNILKETL